MSTLLLRLQGPMQSWGTQSRFPYRDTGHEPSKSGVIGLLCAALGRGRSAPVDDLSRLRLGVRVDQEGSVKVDYQTAGGSHRDDGYGVAKADGSRPSTVLSWRSYLADASFLVGVEGQESLLQELDAALDAPRWPLFLGRKSYPPGEPVRLPAGPPLVDGLWPGPLEDALRRYPWRPAAGPRGDQPQAGLRLVLDPPPGQQGTELRADVPLSFAERTFVTRAVITELMNRPATGAL